MDKQEYQLKKMALAVKAMFGLAAIIAAIGFFVQTTTPAVADAPNNTYSTGKYQMCISSFVTHDGDVAWHILTWNTETGQSNFYYGNKREGIVEAVGKYQLPTNPLD